MCGRYIANSEDEIIEIREILKQISLRLSAESAGITAVLSPLKDIFPTDMSLIINKNGFVRAKFGVMKWDNKGVIINARSETCEQSGFFRPFAKNRCIIPAHGYYEWQKLEKNHKVKYIFKTGSIHGIFMAGIYRTSKKDENENEFAVVTRPAEEHIKFVHDRMPLIIGENYAEAWLSGSLSMAELAAYETGIVCEEAV